MLNPNAIETKFIFVSSLVNRSVDFISFMSVIKLINPSQNSS